jgi:broad-specificity NMP kinase
MLLLLQKIANNTVAEAIRISLFLARASTRHQAVFEVDLSSRKSGSDVES